MTESDNEASADEGACGNGDVDPDATLPYVDLDATLAYSVSEAIVSNPPNANVDTSVSEALVDNPSRKRLLTTQSPMRSSTRLPLIQSCSDFGLTKLKESTTIIEA